MIPTIFSAGQHSNQPKRTVVFLSSPFASLKNNILAFLRKVQSSRVDLYFSVDCELIIDNSYASADIQRNVEKPVCPLPYIVDFFTELLPNIELHAFSLDINTIPILFSSYARTSILRLTDPVRYYISSFQYLFIDIAKGVL